MKYLVRNEFDIEVGFKVRAQHIVRALELTNNVLADLPASLYRSIDYKTTSAVVGSVFCDTLATQVGCIVNPIEKGHPDLIRKNGAMSTEAELRNYPSGLEIKVTIGNIQSGANLRAGEPRLDRLEGITWQAHHREVRSLLGLIWDFLPLGLQFNCPVVTGVFYADNLDVNDWGEISGTTGRNTKVTGMRVSGKIKMGAGWVALLHDEEYLARYSRILRFEIPRQG